MLLPRAKLATRMSVRKEQLVMQTSIPQLGVGGLSQNPCSNCKQDSGEFLSPYSACRKGRYQRARSAVGKSAEQLRGWLPLCQF